MESSLKILFFISKNLKFETFRIFWKVQFICLWLVVNLWSVWSRDYAICSNWLIDLLLLFWHPFLNRVLQMFFLKFTAGKQGSDKSLPRSAKICQVQTRSNGTNKMNTKHTPSNATCRNKSWKRRSQELRGGGVTPHGVFNPLWARRRPRRV